MTGAPTMPSVPVLEAVDVVREYRSPRQSPTRAGTVIGALKGVSVSVYEGESFGIVGESGSGKSTLTRILMALEQPTSGSVLYQGHQISGRPESELKSMRRNVQLVTQNPMSSLNPRMRVFDIIAEPLRALRVPGDHRARVDELLTAVGVSSDSARRYPHQFSGGQRQRISIARALAPHTRVIVADEPVSALDVSVRAQILNLLRDLAEQFGLTLIVISHDLSVVKYLCNRIAVMQSGMIVEQGVAQDIYSRPQEPYTRQLLAAVPTLDGGLLDRGHPTN